MSHVASPVILDVGANVGQTTRLYARLFPTATIHSFEPYSHAYELLASATRRYATVIPHPVALAEESGTRVLHVSPVLHANSSLFPRVKEGRRYYPLGSHLEDAIEVRTETLDSFCTSEELDHVNILKMDVQGGEQLVLRGAEGLLHRQAIDLVYTEFLFVPHYEGGVLFEELLQTFTRHGYSLYNLYDMKSATNGQLSFADGLVISEELRRAVVDKFPPEP